MINKEIPLIPLKGTFQTCHQSKRIEKGWIWLSPDFCKVSDSVHAAEIWIYFYFNQQGLCHRISDQVTTSIWSFFLKQKSLKVYNRLALPNLLRSPPSASGLLIQPPNTPSAISTSQSNEALLRECHWPYYCALPRDSPAPPQPADIDYMASGPPSDLEARHVVQCVWDTGS